MKPNSALGFASIIPACLFLVSGVLAQDFHGCPTEGKGGDPVLNRLKNRTEIPGRFEEVQFEDLAGLDVPQGVSKKHRDQWPQSTLEALAPQEQRSVQVVGYLLKVKLEGRESSNAARMNKQSAIFTCGSPTHLMMTGLKPSLSK